MNLNERDETIIQTTKCPYCHAQPGEQCMKLPMGDMSRRIPASYVHHSRKRAYMTALIENTQEGDTA